MNRTLTGRVHNAKVCTFDGRDCWIASVCDERGRFIPRCENVAEFATKEEALKWLTLELRRRGVFKAEIAEDD